MKKKKLLFTLLLLLVIVIPVSLFVSDIPFSSLFNFKKLSGSISEESGYTYHRTRKTPNSFLGFNNTDWFWVGDDANSAHAPINSNSGWQFHEARKDGKYYSGYCLHISQKAVEGKDLHAFIFTNQDFDGDHLRRRTGGTVDEPLSTNQIKLLQAVLAVGYQYDPTNKRSIDGMTAAEARNMVAMQMLVWEIVEGGRTNLDSIEPNNIVRRKASSGYNLVIKRNAELLGDYSRIVEAAHIYLNSQDSSGGGTIWNKEYKMNWNSNEKRFTTGPLSGLGEFSGCTSSNGDVKIDANYSSDRITIYSNKANQSATITCTYTVGNGKNEWSYYKFVNTNGENYQDIVNGTYGKSVTKKFTVKSSSSYVKVVKKGDDNSNLSGAEFTLTYGSENIKLNGNGDAAQITKSGEYLLKETKAPYGYDKIPDTYIRFDIENKRIDCSGNYIDSLGGNICGNQLKLGYDQSSNTFIITISDVKKTFAIRKVNQSNQPVNGATFKLYTGNNFGTVVKFDKNNETFTYNANGAVTDIVDANKNTYYINLLPKGIYKLVETAVPRPYILPTNPDDVTKYFKVVDNYIIEDCKEDPTCRATSTTPFPQNVITAKNYTTKVDVKKIGNGGKTLPGVKFILYNQDKNKVITATSANGVYTYSGISTNIQSATVFVTNSNGLITLNELPIGTYFFKEIETVDPYVLPEGDDAYTQVTITMTKDGPRVNSKTSTLIEISNATNTFNFYKVDEDGNYLAGGKFKIQKYDDEKGKYVDIKIESVTNDGTYPDKADVFKESNNGKVQFTLAHGIGTFIEMAPSTTYRVVELEAPKGYDVANVDNSAVIKIDRNGYAKGSATIINTSRKLEGSTAQAELIIEIQTGQKVIKYGLIIAGTLILISGLMFVLVYTSKKRK